MDLDQVSEVAYLTYCTPEPRNCVAFERYDSREALSSPREGVQNWLMIRLRSQDGAAWLDCTIERMRDPAFPHRNEMMCVGFGPGSDSNQASAYYPVILPDGSRPQ